MTGNQFDYGVGIAIGMGIDAALGVAPNNLALRFAMELRIVDKCD
jgi:hypothetical protein